MTALEVAAVLTSMADSVHKRDGHPNAGYAHYSLKFALLAGAEKALEIAAKQAEDDGLAEEWRLDPERRV